MRLKPCAKRHRVAGWGVAVLAVTLPATAIGVTQTANARATTQQEAASPILAETPTAADRLPSFLSTGDQALPDFDPQSSQLLGTDSKGIRYWLGKGADHQTCLVALLPGKGEFASMTCGTTDQLYAGGLELEVNDDKVSGRGVYAPAGIDLRPLGMKMLNSQFAAGDADTPLAGRSLQGHAPDGSAKTLKLRPLAAQPAGTGG